MSATVLSRIPLGTPGSELWIYTVQGNPNTGLINPTGVTNALADPAAGSICVQTDGAGGNQLWVKEGINNTWQLTTGSPAVVQLTTTTTLAITQSGSVFECNASGGAFTINLPQLSVDARCDFRVVKSDSSGNAITIAPFGGDSIFGATSLASQGSSLRFYAAPDGWLTAV